MRVIYAQIYSFAKTDAALVNMSSWPTEEDSGIFDQFLPEYFKTRRSFHIQHGVFRSKLGKGRGQDIFDAFNW